MGRKGLPIAEGFMFNNQKVIKEVKSNVKNRKFLVECIKCGRIHEKYISNLIQNKTGCHCTHKKFDEDKLRYYGVPKRMVYIFRGILQRCNNSNNGQYPDYGGRGIKCEWETFEDFYKDMGPTHKEGLSIDRINNDGNYCKENCRWATWGIQANNKRTTIYIDGRSPLKYWCIDNGFTTKANYERVSGYCKKGLSPDEILLKMENRYNRSILQFDKNLVFIKKWNGLRSIYETLGIGTSGISRCCTGHRKKSGGFIWKYE